MIEITQLKEEVDDDDMSACPRDVTEVQGSRKGGWLRHTLDLSLAPDRPLRGRSVRSPQIQGVSEPTPFSRTLYLCDATWTSRHITITLSPVFGLYISCFCFFLLFFIMACFGLQVIFVALAVSCCCCKAASICNVSFAGRAWPSEVSVVDLKDVNATFFNISSNGTVSYKGRPFFFRVTDVFGGSPNSRVDYVRFKLPSREHAIFYSLFNGIPYSDDVAYMALTRIHFPSAPGQFFIKELVVYFENFWYPPPIIPSFPHLYTYRIAFDYGRYK